MVGMSSGSRYLKLPFSFDTVQLARDLDALEAGRWINHFNRQAYEKGWSSIPLRSIGGRPDSIVPADGSDFADTELLLLTPYFRQVIDTFECEKASVRLMALEPGASIKPHRDAGASHEDGLTRLHVPVMTSPEVRFCIDGEYVHFSAGDTWYLNAGCEHAVENPSEVNRVHLMIDCVSNAWLENTFRSAGWIAPTPYKYPDRSIHDGNVGGVISALRSAGHATGMAIADRLQAIHDGSAEA